MKSYVLLQYECETQSVVLKKLSSLGVFDNTALMR
jgi:hypothetical protein